MMDINNMPTDQIEKAVEVRRSAVIRIIQTVEELLTKHGRLAERVVAGAHCKTKHELLNFGPFSFTGTFEMTDFGGNEISILQGSRKVFEAYWQVDPKEKVDVRFFDGETTWDIQLMNNIARQDEIFEVIAGAAKAESEQDKVGAQERERRRKLIEEAKNLALIPKE